MSADDGTASGRRPVTVAPAAGRLEVGVDVDLEPLELGFDEFCRREFAGVAGLAYVLTGDWTAAEDLAQDAFFAAFKRWDQVRRYDNPSAWVRRIVANRSVSWWRRVGAEARAMARLGGRREPGPASVELPERDAELWALVRGLPMRQAQVFALTYVDDLSLEQVADVLDISPGTAKTHLKRARHAIAASRDEPFDPDRPPPTPGAPA